MPWKIKKVNKKYQVISTTSGKMHGTHNTREEAMSQVRALYANDVKENLIVELGARPNDRQ